MTTLADVTAWLDGFAPPRLAEPWDNVGLIWGDPAAAVAKVMTCLTVTRDTAQEAAGSGVGLIVSHHPVLFRPAKAVRADRPEGAALWTLARGGVGVYSPHTAFDNTAGGINDGLARRLGLVDVAPLRPGPVQGNLKLVVFTPAEARGPILEAAFAAGAGRIGNYEECSYSGPGRGTFFGATGSKPATGRAGRRESVREWRVELLCPADRLTKVLAAIRERHPYEEPAIDVYPLHPAADGPGIGRVGGGEPGQTLDGFAKRVATALGVEAVQVVGDRQRSVGRVAITCGAGDDFVGDAARAGADVLLTGEARFHRVLEAEALGIALVLAGHYATERPGVEDLAGRLATAFPGLEVWASRRERDPLAWIAP